MNVIELENRSAEEVFKELKYRLDTIGYLPDEYILMDKEWGNGKMIPEGADIFCTTDYGGSEGIYLDCYLKWYENGKPITKSFFTGKSLGDSGSDMDRMFLISSAITKAFHGDGGQYDRYMRLGEPDNAGGMTLHLNANEQRVFIEALAAQREKLLENTVQAEQLLRRMTGSITAYMDEIGQRPLRLSDYDKTVLAIRDGDLQEFQSNYLLALDQADELLVLTAGRPGTAGRRMMLNLLADAEQISSDTYLAACKGAVDTGDMERVLILLEQADTHLAEPCPSLYGETALQAYAQDDRSHMARQLIRQASPEQIQAAPPRLLYHAACTGDCQSVLLLTEKGISAEAVEESVLHALQANGNAWLAGQLSERWQDTAQAQEPELDGMSL